MVIFLPWFQLCFSSLLTKCQLLPEHFGYWLSAAHVIDLQKRYKRRQICAQVSLFYCTSTESTCLNSAHSLGRKPPRRCWTCQQIATWKANLKFTRTLFCAGIVQSVCTAGSVVTLTPLWQKKLHCPTTPMNLQMMKRKGHHHAICNIFVRSTNVCAVGVPFPARPNPRPRRRHPCAIPACRRGLTRTCSVCRCLPSPVLLRRPQTRVAQHILATLLSAAPCRLCRANVPDAPVRPCLQRLT